MKVVVNMLTKGGPIYTVHDNFITTYHYSHLLPYSEAFRSSPLFIINEFLYMNLINHIVQNQSGDKDNLQTYIDDDFKYGLISKDGLYSFLKENIPENTNGRMLATWEERISGILTSYEAYISHVCGGTQSSNIIEFLQAHNQKWDEFKNNISETAVNGYINYSLHY